ncbi:MAG: substrate-binding periplasmic protein [Nitrososphaerales archaeon]
MRSRLAVSLTALLCSLLLTACAASPTVAPAPLPATPPPAAPAPPAASAPTSAPTAEPAVPAPTAMPSAALPEDDLARVEVTGALRVATALDNPPFSMYDDQKRPAGLDIALITELARRMGLQVEINDVSFDNLVSELQSKKADAAIAAISITPERARTVDFTNVYYVGQDAVVVAPSSSIFAIRSLADLTRFRIGVQRGSIYQTWLWENAVQAGKLPPGNLKLYETPEAGMDGLASGSIDAFVLDRQPARQFAEQGKAKLVGENLYPQVYGIAVRKRSTLLPELNRALAEVQADGTMAKLVQTYLDVAPDEVLPATRQPLPAQDSTPAPTLTP